MIQQLINYFKAKFKTKVVMQPILKSKIKYALPEINFKILNHAQHYLLDEKYSSCSLEQFKKLLKKDFTNWRIYNKDYDCDNFAFKLYSNLKNKYPTLSIGIVLSASHAFNIFVDKLGKVHYIEPQNDKIYDYSKLKTNYKPIIAIIL